MEARRARGLSRERLGALAGLTPRTIYAIEIEGVRPRRATRHVLAEALSCDGRELFPDDHDPPGMAGREVTAEGGDGRDEA
jgi:DNA-binding XRE family transcriptional regulator